MSFEEALALQEEHNRRVSHVLQGSKEEALTFARQLPHAPKEVLRQVPSCSSLFCLFLFYLV